VFRLAIANDRILAKDKLPEPYTQLLYGLFPFPDGSPQADDGGLG